MRKILVVGDTLSSYQTAILKLLMDNGAEVVFRDSQEDSYRGRECDIMVCWDEIAPCIKEYTITEPEQPYYRKFEKRGRW